MSVTKLVLRRPISAIIIVFGLVVFGVMSYLSLPQELTPEMEMPMLIVSTVYPGAAPQDVEKLVTREVEGAAGSLSGIETISSTSAENMSLVILSYDYGTNMDIAYTDLRERLDQIANTLPDDARKPVVVELDVNALATMTLSVSSESLDNLLYVVQEQVSPEFEKLTTVADVSIYGGREEYIRVELDEEKMQRYRVTMNTVQACVSTADFSIPAGTVDYGSQSLTLRSSAQYQTLEAIRGIPIPLQTGDVIRLEDIADISDAVKDADSISRYNGVPNITLSIQKRQSESAVTVSRQVKETVDQINRDFSDLDVTVVYDSSDMIVESLRSVQETLLLGILISMVILLLFLGDFRASLIVGSSMPVSLLVTFMLMQLMGFSMNIVTMSGLVLGVGMMVDNSIVVLDSIFKYKEDGLNNMNAALEGTKFVTMSIVASTITTVVVFLPLATIQGISGQLFGPLGFTIVFSLLASLVSAMTLVPLFFCRFKPTEKKDLPVARVLKKVENGYGKLLRGLVLRKKTVFAATMALLALSLYTASLLNVELIPAIDEGVVNISVETRPGLRLEKVDEILVDLEELVAGHPDVDRYSLSAGGSGIMSGGSPSISVYLKSERSMETHEVVDQWRRETAGFVDCNISVASSNSTAMSSMSSDVQVRLKASDLDVLREGAAVAQAEIESHPDIISVTSTLEDGNPQTEVVVDSLKAASMGMTPIQVASYLNTALNGVDTVTVRRDGQNYMIRIEYPADSYRTVADLEDMLLMSQAGFAVPLVDIADIVFSDGPQSISRQDSQYVVTVTGVPTHEARFSAANEITARMQGLELPEGVAITDNMMQSMIDEEFGFIFQAIIVAVILVFMVMAIQFESIKHSLMVMICIPFSLIGSFAFLYASGSTLSMVSLLGFLILVGTVVNNGILFVDTANQYRVDMPVIDALVETGKTRLRPILMTTMTTILSMLPMALGSGGASDMMRGLALTVIGGLSASTLLTLLLLPTFYLIIDGNPKKKEGRTWKNRVASSGDSQVLPEQQGEAEEAALVAYEEVAGDNRPEEPEKEEEALPAAEPEQPAESDTPAEEESTNQ